MTGSFPSGGDYADSLQHAGRALRDPALRGGIVKTSRMGLPMVMGSGAFASVFQVTSADGGTRWALKCFTKHAADQQERYEQITAKIATVELPSLVGFEYQADGIEVGGECSPS
jgi:hypothetical protein